MVVRTSLATQAAEEAARRPRVAEGRTANETGIGGAPLDDATRLAAEPKTLDISAMPTGRGGRDGEVTVGSLEELVEFFIAAGKKGFDVNRYKGLGEMNPDTLWETTMNPATSDAPPGEGRGPHGGGPDVHDADGRSGRAAPQVHRGQRPRRQEPRYLRRARHVETIRLTRSQLHPPET
jgi:hypothetical protein